VTHGLDDPREELALLASALSEHLAAHARAGTLGLPPASEDLKAERLAGGAEEPASGPPASSEREARFEPPPREVEVRAPPGPPRAEPAALAIEDPAERARALDVIQAEVRECVACGLHSTRTQTVFARGNGSSRLCFVGEGPGADEDAQGYPFVGKAGQLLDRMIEAMGLSPDEVYVANIVKCRPPNNRKPEPDEMAACLHFLERQLAILNPEVIVALGATAVQGLLGTTEGITRLRGKWKLYKGRIAVMPTFHPAYLLRTPSAKREVWADLQAVLRQMGRAVPAPKKG